LVRISLFIGGGQRGLRFGGLALLSFRAASGWMIWLVGWVIVYFCCLGVGFVWSGFAGLPGLTG